MARAKTFMLLTLLYERRTGSYLQVCAGKRVAKIAGAFDSRAVSERLNARRCLSSTSSTSDKSRMLAAEQEKRLCGTCCHTDQQLMPERNIQMAIGQMPEIHDEHADRNT